MLIFHLLNTVHAVTVEVTVNVDDNGHGDRRFGCCHANCEQGEEESFKLPWEENAVECCKVDVNSIENQLSGNEHGNEVPASEEPEDTDEKQHGAQHKEIFYWYHHLLLS